MKTPAISAVQPFIDGPPFYCTFNIHGCREAFVG